MRVGERFAEAGEYQTDCAFAEGDAPSPPPVDKGVDLQPLDGEPGSLDQLLHPPLVEGLDVSPAVKPEPAAWTYDKCVLESLPVRRRGEQEPAGFQHANGLALSSLQSVIVQMLEDFRHHHDVEKTMFEGNRLDSARARLLAETERPKDHCLAWVEREDIYRLGQCHPLKFAGTNTNVQTG
jgi:hypothetical protein